MLFQNKERTFNGPKSYIEGDFEYLDRSARNEAEKVRSFLNYWISKFPEDEANELIARIKSGNKKNFDSAIFEILLFSILAQLGCALTVHPDLPNGSTRHPDFLVTTPEGDEFYLEAVLASEFSADEIAAESRKNTVLNTIEGMESPNFYLGINAKGNPDTPPSGRRLREDLSRWLETLDPDTVKNEIDEGGIDAIPTVNWNHENWDIQFEAFPKSPEKRGVEQRIIGSICSGVRWANIWEPIKNAIKAKGNRYGELDKPYLIAVNVDANSLDRIDEMQALFGQEEFLFNPNSENAQPEMRRIPNGAWYGIEGPQYTRVSGAWLFGNLNPWNIISRKNTLYFNPYAVLELPDLVKQLNHASCIEDKMTWNEGKPLHEILEISKTWPE